MSRFDRFSRITAQERAQALERRAWGSMGLSLLALAALACCGLIRLPAPRAQGQGTCIACLWAEPACSPAEKGGARPHFAPPPRQPAPEPHILTAENATALPALPDMPPPEAWPPPPPRQDPFSPPELPAPAEPAATPAPPQQNRLAKAPAKERAAARKAAKPAATAAAAAGTRGEYTPPAYQSAPKPPYPPGLRQRRIEGSVRVRIAISKEGAPASVAIAASSGHAEFDETARQWILRHWRFAPALRNGIPVPSAVATSVHFVLD